MLCSETMAAASLAGGDSHSMALINKVIYAWGSNYEVSKPTRLVNLYIYVSRNQAAVVEVGCGEGWVVLIYMYLI